MVVDGLRELRRGELGKNSLVPICTKFISTAVSSPTITGGSFSGNNAYIKVKPLVCRLPIVSVNFEVKGNFCAAQAKRLPLHTPTQDAVDLAKMVQVVCRFQADELLDRLPSAYLVDPIALHPPCARDRLQQSQVALAQRPKDH